MTHWNDMWNTVVIPINLCNAKKMIVHWWWSKPIIMQENDLVIDCF